MIEVGEYWKNQRDEIYKITAVSQNGVYPIIARSFKTNEIQSFTITGHFSSRSGEIGEFDLVKQINREENPEYFL